MVGTFVNRNKIESNNPFGLNCGDLIGIGCPESCSSKDGVKETFVYRLRSPRAFHAQVVEAAGPVLQEDDPTPPASPWNQNANHQGDNLPLPDLVRRGSESLSIAAVEDQEDVIGGYEGNVMEGENGGRDDGHQEGLIANNEEYPVHPCQVVKKENVYVHDSDDKNQDDSDGARLVKISDNNPTVITLDSSDEGAQPDSQIAKRSVKRLFSGSYEEETLGASKVPRYTPHKFRPVLCSLPYLKVPDRAVAGQLVTGQDKVARWDVVSPDEYKMMTRRWAGLSEDGSDGALFLEKLEKSKTDLSDISSDEMLSPGQEIPDMSPISSEEEEEMEEVDTPVLEPFNTTTETTSMSKSSSSDLVKYGDDKTGEPFTSAKPSSTILQVPPLVKQEPGTGGSNTALVNMNYSQNEEVIEILDSSDEEDYETNQSQSVMSPVKTGVDLDDIDDLLRDSPSPTFERDEEPSDISEEDDDDIEILNESQSSLYATIFKTVHKVEPDIETNNSIRCVEDDETESQSLLDEAVDELEDSELIAEVLDVVEGADENMVRSAIRRCRLGNKEGEAIYLDVIQVVKLEVEDNMVRKLSGMYNCSARQVKICLADLKAGVDDKIRNVTEEEVKKSLITKLEEDELIKIIESEFKYSKDKIREAIKSLRLAEHSVDKEKVVAKVREGEDLNECIASIAESKGVEENVAREAVVEVIKNKGNFDERDVMVLIDEKCSFNKKVDSIRMEIGGSEELVRSTLEKNNGDADAAAAELGSKLLLHEKSKNLAEIYNTSVEYAKEVLEESGLDEAVASQAIEEAVKQPHQLAESLAETFDIHVDLAAEVLEKSNNDLVKASQILMDKMDAEARKDEPQPEHGGACLRSISPDFDDDSDFEELLKDCEELKANSPSKEDSQKTYDLLSDKDLKFQDIHSDLSEKPKSIKLKEKSSKDLGASKPSIESDASSKPSFSKEISVNTKPGVKLIEPIAMPHRRAFNRGISATTVDSLNKKEEAARKPQFPSTKQVHRSENLMLKLRNSEKPRSKSKDEVLAERKEKLKKVEEDRLKMKKPVVEKPVYAQVGKMKSSVPKNQKLLQEMQEAGTMGPPRRRAEHGTSNKIAGRERRLSGPETGDRPGVIGQRRSSAGFLEEESNRDKVKKNKYSATHDGYKAVKKMSMANIDYNIMSQDISKMRVDAKPLKFTGIEPKKIEPKKIKKKLSWRDKTGLESLVDVREIPAENKGIKCGTGNKELELRVAAGKNDKRTGGKKELELDDVFKTILEWKCIWLEEQKKQKEPPHVQGNRQMITLTETFSSGEEYTKIFLPMMLHELWSTIVADYEEKVEAKREEIVPICLQEVSKDLSQQFNIIRCVGLLTDQEARRDLGADGTLVQLNMGFIKGVVNETGKQAREIKPCFGYVQHTQKMAYRGMQEMGEMDRERVKLLEVAAEKNNRKGYLRHIVLFTVKTKLNLGTPDKIIATDKPIYLKVLSRIKPELRKFEAVLSLPMSKLHNILIKPTSKNFQLGLGSEFLHAFIKDVTQFSGDSFNSLQKRSVVSMARACLADPSAPKVCLMQGPPGTGKSSTITGLVLQILYSGMEGGKKNSMPRILVVAPSNAAVDELALKLLTARRGLPEDSRFRLVRLGVEKSMKKEVVGYSFSANVERMMTKGTRRMKAADTLEQDQKTKQVAANKIFEEKIAAENAGNIDLASKLHRDWKDKIHQIEKIKEELKKPLDSKSERNLRKNAEDMTMADADVILSTLSSSLSWEMEKYFVKGVGTARTVGSIRPISICIMDEASQCVEPEALIPLKLGFTKLVMVGDHEQLPATVTSMKAKKYGYQQSLFGRLFSFLTGGPSQVDNTSAGNTPPMVVGKCPVLRLEIQYRMHTEIAEWPSR